MSFEQEETGYAKTAISDLQGAWMLLRDQVVKEFGFEGSDRLLFHIDEAKSWECVRALNQMKPLILVIDNIAKQTEASDEIVELFQMFVIIMRKHWKLSGRAKLSN